MSYDVNIILSSKLNSKYYMSYDVNIKLSTKLNKYHIVDNDDENLKKYII